MKRRGILNAGLSGALARLGHTDLVVVCDAGLPLPYDVPGVEIVDLAFILGEPRFETVLRGLLEEIVVDGGVAASEVVASNEECHHLLTSLVQPLELVPHEAFKALTRRARLVVRTGEDRPYANVGLRCGVPF